jgi:MATE family multidrug resistance protein
MNALRQSWRLAWPLILSNLSVPLLGAVDTALVGHLDEPHHLAAVALGATTMSVVYFVLGFLRMGTTALTAQAFGAGDGAEAAANLLRGLIVGATLGALVLAGSPAIVLAARLVFAPGAAAGDGLAAYVAIRCVGAPAALATLVLLGWFLGLQDGRRPLALMLATNGLNAALGVGLVLGLGWGVPGVALATVLAEYAGLGIGLLLARHYWRRLGVPPRAGALLQPARFRRLLLVNRDLFLRNLLLQASFVGFTMQGSRQGELVLAANAVLLTFFTFTAYALDGFAHATEAMVGRCLGARDLGAFRAAVHAGLVNATILAVLLSWAFWVGGPSVIGLLTSLPEVRALAVALMPFAALLPVVSVWAFLLDGIYFGAARATVLRNAMLASVAVFAVLAPILPPILGNSGLWLAFLVFLGARGLFLGLAYRGTRHGAAFIAG